MIKLTLKAFLLLTFTVAAGLLPVSLVSHAQQSTNSLTGEWVGNSDPPGRAEFLRLNLTENAGEILKPLEAKLTVVQRDGDRVRIELRRDAWITSLRFTQTEATILWRSRQTIPTGMSASNDSHRVSSKRWSTGPQHRFVSVPQQSVKPLTLWLCYCPRQKKSAQP
jgi:hypothetical protein